MQLKFRSVLLLIIIFSFTCAKAGGPALRGKITGRVTDKNTGRPIAGATITIPDLKIAAATDTGGRFELKNLPAGSI